MSIVGRARFLAVVCAALLLALAPARALDFPALSGRVVDEAGILDQATKDDLTAKLAELETKTGDQLVVVTLKSLRGTTIEDYGVQLGRAWKIGQKDKNNGVLLLVAPNERKVRIEVGYGLEGTLTDAIGRFIIETAIVPRFRSNDVAGGIRRGADDITQVLGGAASEYKQLAENRYRQQSGDDGSWLVFLFVAIVIFIILFSMFSQSRTQQAGRGRRSSPWVQTWPTGGSFPSGWGGGGGGGGFSGGGGSFGGGGASGSW